MCVHILHIYVCMHVYIHIQQTPNLQQHPIKSKLDQRQRQAGSGKEGRPANPKSASPRGLASRKYPEVKAYAGFLVLAGCAGMNTYNPHVPVLRASWSPLDVAWSISKGSRGVLVEGLLLDTKPLHPLLEAPKAGTALSGLRIFPYSSSKRLAEVRV